MATSDHQAPGTAVVPDESRRRSIRRSIGLCSLIIGTSLTAMLMPGSPAWSQNRVDNNPDAASGSEHNPQRFLGAASPRRIVSVGGALTEIMFALHADADLVGVDTTSVYPASARQLPSVGYARSLSAEGVLALAPTHVIATEDAGPPVVLQHLANAGIPIHILAANHRFEGVLDRIRRVGELTERMDAATALQQGLTQTWERSRRDMVQRARQRGQSRPPIRVLFILAHTPNQIMVAGGNTSADAMIRYVGAINATQESAGKKMVAHTFSGYKPLTPESVIAARPDVILLTDQGFKAAGGMNGILQLPGIDLTPAGQHQRIISLEAMFLLGFGPRLPEAVNALEAAITTAIST